MKNKLGITALIFALLPWVNFLYNILFVNINPLTPVIEILGLVVGTIFSIVALFSPTEKKIFSILSFTLILIFVGLIIYSLMSLPYYFSTHY